MGGISEKLKLVGTRASPYVNRVQIALNLKSLNYEFIQENNLPTEKSELLLKSNPVHKKVPVFIHKDKPINESLVIVEYIDEVWTTTGHSILPSDPYERAIARIWASYIDLKLFPASTELRSSAQDEDEDSKKAAFEKVIEGMHLLEDVFVKSSKGKPFFGGDEIGYLDIVLGSFLGWFKLTEIVGKVNIFDEVKTPKLVGWAAAFLSYEATINVMPDQEEVMEFYKRIVQARLATVSK